MRLNRRGGNILLAVIVGFVFLCPGSPGWCQSGGQPALYDFGMGICLSCKEMERILDSIKNKYGDQIEVRLVYVEQDKDLFTKHKIVAVPTQIFFDASGQEVDRHLGLFPEKELVQKLKDLKFIKK